MSYILDIATAVPEHLIERNSLVEFYRNAVGSAEPERFQQKLNFLARKTRINARYSCIPDYNGVKNELFKDSNYGQPVEKRLEVYRQKIVPLACDAINKLLAQNDIEPNVVTHLITVSCTGVFAPGIEFLIAEQYGIQNIEKTGINFLGCYAAIKALKHAHYIAQANPSACVLIVCAELCSLHFYPSDVDEDIVSNLLFADGAAAVILCGDKLETGKKETVLQVNNIGSAFIPGTSHLMKWEPTSSAFKMYLSPAVVTAIKNNIKDVLTNFIGDSSKKADHWAIHPGGVKIIEAIQKSLDLSDENVEDSLAVLSEYGNMSSPTVLFILKRIFDKIKRSRNAGSEQIFSCAFGPGLNVELLTLSSLNRNE